MRGEIKPCPFCGGIPEIMFQPDDIGDYRAQCDCGATCGGLVYTEENAINYWNRRAESKDNLQTSNNKLKAEIAACLMRVSFPEKSLNHYLIPVDDYERLLRLSAV